MTVASRLSGNAYFAPGPRLSAGLLPARLREQGDVRANIEMLRDAATPTFEAVAQNIDEPSAA